MPASCTRQALHATSRLVSARFCYLVLVMSFVITLRDVSIHSTLGQSFVLIVPLFVLFAFLLAQILLVELFQHLEFRVRLAL